MSSIVRTSARATADVQLKGFFFSSVSKALRHQQLQAQEKTVRYIANLLTRYSRSRDFYEQTEEGLGLRTLTEYYGQALHGRSAYERADALQRLGDVALFIAGLLSGSLNRKVVDIDYYIAMGGSAYGQLSSAGASAVADGSAEVFEELSKKFSNFVDVLDEVAERAPGHSNTDVMRTYEIWLRTRSPRAARRLRRHGIDPAQGSVSRRQH